MASWVVKCYLAENGKDVIDEWYQNELAIDEQAKFDQILEYMTDTPHHQWHSKIVKALKGYEGILEIRFKVRNRLHRPLICFGRERGEFTILMPAREQGDEFIPKNAPEIAVIRRKEILSDKERSRECFF